MHDHIYLDGVDFGPHINEFRIRTDHHSAPAFGAPYDKVPGTTWVLIDWRHDFPESPLYATLKEWQGAPVALRVPGDGHYQVQISELPDFSGHVSELSTIQTRWPIIDPKTVP